MTDQIPQVLIDYLTYIQEDSSFYNECCEWLNDWMNSSIVLILIVSAFLFTLVQTDTRRYIYSHLKSLALSVFLCGFILYFLGFNYGGSSHNAAVLVLRSILSSLEMFASKSSLLGVSPLLKNSSLYMLAFTLIHFIAVYISAIFIIKLFGYRLYSYLKLVYTHLMCWLDKYPDTSRMFVFMGVNSNSITLAESIKKRLTDDALIIFISLPNDNRSEIFSSRFTFSHLFNQSNMTSSNFIDRIEMLNAILLQSESIITPLLLKDVVNDKDFFDQIGLKRFGKIQSLFSIKHKIEIYILSDHENDNIDTLLTLKKLDITNRNSEQPSGTNYRNLQVYCHARCNNFNDKLLLLEGMEHKVHLIDSSLLSIMQLKKDIHHHPVSFVKRDFEKGVVTSEFQALIIGLGETGSDALRFLYEFSTFIGIDGKEQFGKFHIVDHQIQKVRSEFLITAPALQDSAQIDWWKCQSTHSTIFWNRLKDEIDHINYIMVSIDNDDEAKLLISQIYEQAYAHRKDLNRFRIYVRLKDSIYKGLVKCYSQCTELSTGISNSIKVFGTVESIFDYQVLKTDTVEEKAKDFYYSYQAISANQPSDKEEPLKPVSLIGTREEIEQSWNLRREYKNGKKRHSFEEFTEIQYKEAQDISNVWHIITKRALAGVINQEFQMDMQRLKYMQRLLQRNAQNEYPNAKQSPEKDLLDNLSKCEHLRWMAKMQLLGFVKGEKDFRKQTHPCMVMCQELEEKYGNTIIYDREVVELSFNDKYN